MSSSGSRNIDQIFKNKLLTPIKIQRPKYLNYENDLGSVSYYFRQLLLIQRTVDDLNFIKISTIPKITTSSHILSSNMNLCNFIQDWVESTFNKIHTLGLGKPDKGNSAISR